jgi:hypothetical protein
MAGFQFSERVTDITYQNIMPSIVDQINNSNVLLARLLNKPGTWKGVTETQPIQTANSTTGGSFSGMDTFPTAATNNTRLYTWYVAAYEQSVVVPGIERAVNSGSDKQVLKLLTTRMDEAKTSANQAVGQIAYGYGAGKDFDGLGLIVDNGTSTASYGGLTRATSPYVNADVTATLNGTITLDYLSSEFDNVSAAGSTSESPTIGLTTKAIWTFVEGLIQPMVSARYDTLQLRGYDRVDGGTPNGITRPGTETSAFAGFNAINYRGRPLVADDNATSGTFFWLNEEYLQYKRLIDPELKQIDSQVEVTEGYYKDVKFPSAWQFRELMSPVNQYGEVGLFILMGNFICTQPRRNGKLTGITSN